VAVPKNLCARIPDNVTFEQAAYAGVGAIALEGVRLARVELGSSVLVIGLGLVGQITVALLKAQGCRVFATDVENAKLALARDLGADAVGLGAPAAAVAAFSGGAGVDAVIITAATPSNAPIEFAAEAARAKGRIVLVGVVGLDIPRAPFFRKELEFTVSYSMGAGRGEWLYEDRGMDYPIGYARWTVQRNLQAVLDTIAAGRLPVDRLTTHRFDVEHAGDAYDLVTSGKEPYLGIVLQYRAAPEGKRVVAVHGGRAPAAGDLGVSVVGMGNFGRLVLMPVLERMPRLAWRGVVSAKGVSAVESARSRGFAYAATDIEEVLADDKTNAVFLLTRHDLHADYAIAALRAGKHVFVEKPLCIATDELQRLAECVDDLGERAPVLMVGFNRRFAPATATLRSFFDGVRPLSIAYRFAAGPVPADHWTQDDDVGGGRVVGEACHAIDLCTALCGSAPVEVYGNSAAADDRAFLTLRHADGSASMVAYQSGGDRGFPPERIEVFGGGRTAALSNWNDGELWSGGKKRAFSGGKDKGHAAELAAFVDACRGGGAWPIPWADLYGVTWASLMAVQSLREGMPIRREI
jgi:predicted dehydrogenase